jgi:hypothetical protein
VHSRLFGCLTNLGAKWAEVVQKFVPRSRIGIFRNEHTQCTPLHPKLTFWCVSYYLGAFGTVWLPYKTRSKTGRTSAKVRATKSRRNFSQRTHPILPIELVQKFVPRSSVGIFHNERNRSTQLDPKPTFWCVSYYLGAFGTVWLPYETRCKTGRTSAIVRATKSHQNFSQRTHPIHPIGPLTDVLVRFILVGCIRDCLVALRNSVQNGPN